MPVAVDLLEPEVDEESQERHLEIFAENFPDECNTLLKQYIEYFFRDKIFHCGGSIPHSLLLSPRRVSMVLNYDIIKSVDRAYNHLEPLLPREEVENAKITGEATSDIRLVHETLRLMSKSGVPQELAGGMMLLYLEFVEGVDIGDEP